MKTDGGSAFPLRFDEVASQGMSLRDYFAAKVLPNAIAHEVEMRRAKIQPGAFRYDEIAKAAYVLADAMLAERAK